MSKHLHSAYETAILILFLLGTFDSEKSKTSTRFRISRRTIRRISLRARLEESFVADLYSEVAGLGWAAFPIDDNVAFVANTIVDDWPRIGTKGRLIFNEILDDLTRGRTKKFLEVVAERQRLTSKEDED